MDAPTVELTAYVDVYRSTEVDHVNFNVWSSNLPPPPSLLEGVTRYRLKFRIPDPREPVAEVEGRVELADDH